MPISQSAVCWYIWCGERFAFLQDDLLFLVCWSSYYCYGRHLMFLEIFFLRSSKLPFVKNVSNLLCAETKNTKQTMKCFSCHVLALVLLTIICLNNVTSLNILKLPSAYLIVTEICVTICGNHNERQKKVLSNKCE